MNKVLLTICDESSDTRTVTIVIDINMSDEIIIDNSKRKPLGIISNIKLPKKQTCSTRLYIE